MIKKIVLHFIRFYQQALSPLKGPTCKFIPTCSAYTYEAIEKHGVCKGLYLGMRRILKCHPFSSGGIDVVPPVKRK